MEDDKLNNSVDVIYNEVVESIETESIGLDDLMALVSSTIVVVQKYKGLTGGQKKGIVVQVMTNIVNDSGLVPEKYANEANMFLKIALPPAIDTLVGAYKNHIDFKEIAEGCGCFGK